jgi:hypothetical protein
MVDVAGVGSVVMSDTPSDESDDVQNVATDAENQAATTASTTYKVLGELADAAGAGVLGRNTAGSGSPVGVEGAVPNAGGGYGLYTADDAKVDGTAELAAVDTTGSDFKLTAGTTSTNDATNVVLGHASNDVTDSAIGATVGGGGFDDGSTVSPNIVSDNYGTVAGGKGNTASGRYATVSGGRRNRAQVKDATVGGGEQNTVSSDKATVSGGSHNTASDRWGTVGGGYRNSAEKDYTTIGGGARNTVGGLSSTVAGGRENSAASDYATVGGGENNTATSGVGGAVAGGTSNAVTAERATVGGGDGNAASGRYASVSGGRSNSAQNKDATVGGGQQNTVSSDRATVSGGSNNTASDRWATIGGGYRNSAEKDYTTIGGGARNTVGGLSSTVAGGRENSAASDYATVGGGENNEADASHATIAGGGSTDGSDSTGNVVHDDYGTVGGGGDNQAGDAQSGTTSATYATVGGGEQNSASAPHATVGGGEQNSASAPHATIDGGEQNTVTSGSEYATVGGGEYNVAQARYATIAGGGPSDGANRTDTNNVVYDKYGTVGGGGNNQAGDAQFGQTNAIFATVSGGESNVASNNWASVGGGRANEAHASYDTVAGGSGNRTGTSGTGETLYATVPGGRDNVAEGAHSFAAGRQAEALTDGAFVWADATSGSVTSTSANQFIVEAGGGAGVGESDPRTQFHVTDDSGGDSAITGHTALVEDTDASNARGLAIKLGDAAPNSADNYVTFYDSGDGARGAIEGNSSGDVQLNSASADYAEYLPRLHPDEEIEPADVVGVVDGAVTRDTANAEQALVVSDRPIVTGNSPGPTAEHREGHEVCAFVGQVPVKVRGPVDAGDLVVPAGEHDGTARAVAPDDYDPGEGPVVGRAWEATDEAGVEAVTVAVGLETGQAVDAALASQRDRIADLETENAALREETAHLREETAHLRERLTALETEVGDAGVPADD